MCKVFCNKCGHKCSADDLLKGFNPFSGYNLLGCPECYALDDYTVACEVDDCWKKATCGTPTNEGYKQTCGEHKPKHIEVGNGQH